jgi:hypothetical protein
MHCPIVILFVSSLVACAAPADDSSTVTGEVSASCVEANAHEDLQWIQDNIFDKSCGFSSCHGGTTPAGKLSLAPGQSYAALVGLASTAQPSWKRVVAGDSGSSYLMVALGAVAGPLPESGTMPAGQDPLCDEKRDAIARWIDAGARP